MYTTLKLKGRVFWLQIYSLRDKTEGGYRIEADGNLQNTLHTLFLNRTRFESVNLTVPHNIKQSDINYLLDFGHDMLNNKLTLVPVEYSGSVAETRNLFKKNILDRIGYGMETFDTVVSDFPVDLESDNQINHWCQTYNTKAEHRLSKEYETFVFNEEQLVIYPNAQRQGACFTLEVFLYNMRRARQTETYDTVHAVAKDWNEKPFILWPYRLEDRRYNLRRFAREVKSDITVILTNPTNAKEALEEAKTRIPSACTLEDLFGRVDNREAYLSLLYMTAYETITNLFIPHYEADFHTSLAEHLCLVPNSTNIRNESLAEIAQTYIAE